MAGLAAVSSILSIAGTVVSAAGTIAAGRAQKKAADYQAAGLDIKAKEERAAAQRQAMEIKRNKNLALSRVQALAGAGGFSATDPTVLNIMGETEKYGTYQQQLAQYGGDSRAQGTKEQAEGLRISGQAAQSAATSRAFGTIIGGVSTMFDRYGRPNYSGANTARRYG